MIGHKENGRSLAGGGPLAVGPLLIGLHMKAADRVVVQICVIPVGHGF